MLTAMRFGSVLLLALPLAGAAQQKVMLPASDKPLTEKPATAFSIGAEDGEDWELLSGVRQVAFDAKDNLYVLDGNNHRVLVFDANGKFVRKIGKKGGGPGELMAPMAMTIDAAGNIVVNDLGRRAYSIFRTDGTFIKNVVLDGADGGSGGAGSGGGARSTNIAIGPGGSGIRAYPRGGVLTRTMASMLPPNLASGGGDPVRIGSAPTGLRKSTFDLIDLTTGKSRSLFEITLPSVTPKVNDEGGSGGQRRVSVMIQIPTFTAPISFGPLPAGGLALVHEADYRVKLVGPDGKLTRTIERDIKPRRVTDSDKKRWAELRRENQRRGTDGVRISVNNGNTSFSSAGAAAADIPSTEELIRTATFMEVIPVLNRIETDLLGRIWIQRTAADLGLKGPVDLVAADGRYIGTIPSDRAPDAVSVGNRAAYIERDYLGVEHVVVKRLPASWR